jgi:hypothetical protein
MTDDANGVDVANSALDTGLPRIPVASSLIDGKRFQKVIPCDASGTPTAGTTQDINLAEFGGVATSLGQKAEASSIPVVLATEQDTAKDGTETSQGQFTGIGVLKAAPFEGNPAWAAWPAAENGIPYISVYGYNDAAQQPVQIIALNDSATVTNGAGTSGLVTRSFIQGPLSSSTSDSRAAYIATGTPGASDPGLVTRNIPSGEQDISYADPVVTTGNITANGQTVSVALAGKNSVVFQIGGTYGSVAIIFEGTVDGTNWLTIQACRLDSNTIETASGTISNTRRAWEASVNGLHSFRVRATAYTSGTANIQINAGYSATEPIPAIASHAVTLASTTITSVVPGTAATSLGKAIDSIPGATDTGIANLAQRVDSPTTLTPANLDYFLLRGDSFGRLWTAAVQSGAWAVSLTGSKTAGATPYRNLDVNATGVVVSAGAAYLSHISAFNTTGATIYLKLYNKATAATSADTPSLVYPIAAGAENNPSSVIGFLFGTGLSIRCTTGVADADNTSPAANGCIVNLATT